MNKKKVSILLILLLLALVLGIIFFNLANKPETAPVEESVVIAEVAPPAVVEEKVEEVAVEEEVKVPKPARKLPRTRISERKIWGGNNGYFVRDEEYVYFGIYTTIREEVPVR